MVTTSESTRGGDGSSRAPTTRKGSAGVGTYNLASLLENTARQHPDREAIVLGETRLTYATVDSLANKVANLLVSRGIKPGDKVAISCPNVPSFSVIYYGILKAGATVVPLNVLFKAPEIAYHLGDSDAVAYFCFEGTAELPMARTGYVGFGDVDACEHFFVITSDPGADSPIEGVETLYRAMADQPDEFSWVCCVGRGRTG